MKKIKIFVLLVFFSVTINAQVGNNWEQKIYLATSQDEFDWTKDTTVIFNSAYTPSAIIDSSGTFYLYYMTQSNAASPESLMVSISPDGKIFTNSYPVNVIGSTVKNKINPCEVITTDYKIKIFYVDNDSGKRQVMHSAISSDGINFTNDTIIQIAINSLSKNFPDTFSIYNPDIYDRRGVWGMFFESGNNLMHATSTDCVNFSVDSTFLFSDIASTTTPSGCG